MGCRQGCGRRSFTLDRHGDIGATRADVCARRVTRPLQVVLLLWKTGVSQMAAARHTLAFARKWNDALAYTIAPMKLKQITQLWCAASCLKLNDTEARREEGVKAIRCLTGE